MPRTLLLLLLSTISLAAHATADGPDHYRVSGIPAGGYVNLRAEPGAQSAIIGWIPAGATCLRNLGCKGGLTFDEFTTLSDEDKRRRAKTNPRWCRVEYQGVTGWVKGGYLAERTCSPLSPEQQEVVVDLPAKPHAVSLRGRIRGHQFIDYRVPAGAGQQLQVSLRTGHRANYFNLLPPGSADVAMYIGSSGDNRFAGLLPSDGEYTVRVYLMRSAARRNEVAAYRLDIALSGEPLQPLPEAQDARIPGTPYHAQAPVTCAPPYATEAASCEAFVARRGFDGTATVDVQGANQYRRSILFIRGEPVASDAMRALSYAREGDRIRIEFGKDEWVEIVEALLTGG
jgi:hypothetical protein